MTQHVNHSSLVRSEHDTARGDALRPELAEIAGPTLDKGWICWRLTRASSISILNRLIGNPLLGTVVMHAVAFRLRRAA
ncbi:hypothetical protein AMST5_03915 [freshwater sediment metagenome]|uniref:Uncharacterized protein n=1 Tax=freshwater sediment metagenome TaxID=556182 RepID=A0AA48M4R0_9ZZZZ